LLPARASWQSKARNSELCFLYNHAIIQHTAYSFLFFYSQALLSGKAKQNSEL
jgi:hypothetical protein